MSGKPPTVLQAFAIASCGAALAFFSCLGGAAIMGNIDGASSRAENMAVLAGLAGFVVGLIICLVGGVLVIVRMFRAVMASNRIDAPAEPPRPPVPPTPPDGE